MDKSLIMCRVLGHGSERHAVKNGASIVAPDASRSVLARIFGCYVLRAMASMASRPDHPGNCPISLMLKHIVPILLEQFNLDPINTGSGPLVRRPGCSSRHPNQETSSRRPIRGVSSRLGGSKGDSDDVAQNVTENLKNAFRSLRGRPGTR